MNLLVIEDEELTSRKLVRMLTEIAPDAHIVAVLSSVEDSVNWLRTNAAPDLIFMDIELSDGQSFEIFNQIAVTSPVIFTTAYDEFAIKAFRVNSIDYLLKPVKEEDLRRALDKMQNLKNLWQTSTGSLPPSIEQLLKQLVPPSPPAPQYRDRFLIKQGQRLFTVKIEEVAYFFSRNKISFIKTFDKKEWMVDYTLDELDKMLDHRQFFRLNRQIISSLQAVDKVHLYFNNKLKINLSPEFDEEVIVSREKATDLKYWMGE